MNEEWITRIYTYQTDGIPKVGTAYPVTETLLLTALHVVEYPNQDQTKGLEIVWANKLLADDLLSVDAIVYRGTKHNCDIALVRCKQTPISKLEEYPKVAEFIPKEHSIYSCRGYPIAGEDIKSEKHRQIPAHGKFAGGYKTSCFELLCNTEIKLEKNWGGLSGAPVFYNGQICGVVESRWQPVERMLYAVSLVWLLNKDEDFRAFLTPKIEILVDFSSAIKYLNNQEFLKNCLHHKIAKENPFCHRDAQSLVSVLSKNPISELIQTIYDLQQEHENHLERKYLADFLRLLLPCVFNSCYISTLYKHHSNRSAKILSLPYATDISAETLMAAFDKRATDFKVFEKEYDLVVRAGRYRLPLAPEAGVDVDSQDIDLDLASRFDSSCDFSKMEIAVDSHLYDLSPNRQRTNYSTIDRKKLVQGWLARKEKHKEPSFYWIFIFGDDEVENERMHKFAATLKESYPQIVQLGLKADVDQENNEYDLFYHLAETQRYC